MDRLTSSTECAGNQLIRMTLNHLHDQVSQIGMRPTPHCRKRLRWLQHMISQQTKKILPPLGEYILETFLRI